MLAIRPRFDVHVELAEIVTLGRAPDLDWLNRVIAIGRGAGSRGRSR